MKRDTQFLVIFIIVGIVRALTEVASAKLGMRLFKKTFSSFVNSLRRPIHSRGKISLLILLSSKKTIMKTRCTNTCYIANLNQKHLYEDSKLLVKQRILRLVPVSSQYGTGTVSYRYMYRHWSN